MDILGLAILAGTEYLRKYPWAPTALKIIEDVIQKKPPINGDNSGRDLEQFIESLPKEQQDAIKKHRFEIQQELKEMKVKEEPQKVKDIKQKHVFSLLALGGILTIMVLTAIAYGIVGWQTGEVPDMGFMIRLLDLLKEVAEGYLSTV